MKNEKGILHIKHHEPIYLNSLVENALSQYSDSIRPQRAEIVDATFTTNDDEFNSRTGLWNYLNDNLGHMTAPDQRNLIEKIYGGLSLKLALRQEGFPISWICIGDKIAIRELLADNLTREKISMYLSQMKFPEKEREFTEFNEDFSFRDSCLPLIKTPIDIYRQPINGHHVLGTSKNREYLNLIKDFEQKYSSKPGKK